MANSLCRDIIYSFIENARSVGNFTIEGMNAYNLPKRRHNLSIYYYRLELRSVEIAASIENPYTSATKCNFHAIIYYFRMLEKDRDKLLNIIINQFTVSYFIHFRAKVEANFSNYFHIAFCVKTVFLISINIRG